jgi:hypothetical protein
MHSLRTVTFENGDRGWLLMVDGGGLNPVFIFYVEEDATFARHLLDAAVDEHRRKLETLRAVRGVELASLVRAGRLTAEQAFQAMERFQFGLAMHRMGRKRDR